MLIGELARKAGVATSAIRFYEEAGLLPVPERTTAGYRVYDPAVIDRVAFIRAGQAVGLTLKELGDVLQIRDGGDPPCHHVADLIHRRMQEVDERIRDLRKLRLDLADLAAVAADLDPEECTDEGVCRILRPRDRGRPGNAESASRE